jgi:signal transduction histidine kinase
VENEPFNLLLIEGNPGDARLIWEMLAQVRGSRFNLECCNRLSAGLERLAEGRVDVLLLNLSLPDSQGLDTFLRAHAQAPEVPIMVLTGLDDEALAIKAVQDGAQDYLVKEQMDADLLGRAIRYAIERHRIRAELERQARALQSSEARLRNIIEKNADGIIIVNGNGIVSLVNPAAESIFGRKIEELLGQPFGFPVVGGETTELDIMRRDGERVVADMRVVEIEWEGENAYLASLHDVTERKRAEEALHELDRMKSEFIAATSHELRTPLFTIQGFVKLLLDGKVPDAETQKEFLSIIDREGDRLGHRIDDLLDISVVESGGMKLRKKGVSIKEVVQRVVANLQSLAREQEVTLEAELPPTLPELIGDEQRLEQVVSNLIDNAIKFSPEKGRVIVRTSAEDGKLLVQVIDQGIGIPGTAIPHLFEKFFQVNGSTTRTHGGAGLGLYIAKQIVEAHGGQIWVESKVSAGSTFNFSLPLSN